MTTRLSTLIAAAMLTATVPAGAADHAESPALSGPHQASAMSGYLKLGDIKGESTDAQHKDWINLLSVSSNLSRPMGAGASQGPGRIEIKVRGADKATPKLLESAAKGKVFPRAELHTKAPAGAQQPYLQLELQNVRITSYQLGATGDKPRPTESLSLSYQKIVHKGAAATPRALPVLEQKNLKQPGGGPRLPAVQKVRDAAAKSE